MFSCWMQLKACLSSAVPLSPILLMSGQAPVFEMRMFTSFVLPTLADSYTGWGLDIAWPFLLKYPHDRIGVIDAVCLTHPAVQPEKVRALILDRRQWRTIINASMQFICKYMHAF